ncbi:MAG: hypothetical protein ABR591_01320 [Candidatus Velthaea sp.]
MAARGDVVTRIAERLDTMAREMQSHGARLHDDAEGFIVALGETSQQTLELRGLEPMGLVSSRA